MISDSDDEVMLIEQFAKARGIEPGDEIRIQIGGVQRKLNVVGIVANPEYIYLMENAQSLMPDEVHFGVCYVTESFGQQVTGLTEVLMKF